MENNMDLDKNIEVKNLVKLLGLSSFDDRMLALSVIAGMDIKNFLEWESIDINEMFKQLGTMETPSNTFVVCKYTANLTYADRLNIPEYAKKIIKKLEMEDSMVNSGFSYGSISHNSYLYPNTMIGTSTTLGTPNTITTSALNTPAITYTGSIYLKARNKGATLKYRP